MSKKKQSISFNLLNKESSTKINQKSKETYMTGFKFKNSVSGVGDGGVNTSYTTGVFPTPTGAAKKVDKNDPKGIT